MVVVKKKKGESKETVFRKFGKTLFEENIVNDLRKRQFYKKPSLVRKEEKKERILNRILSRRTKNSNKK